MFFPFTFTMSVPGIINPFSSYSASGTGVSRVPVITNSLQEKQRLSQRRPHPSTLSPPPLLVRKRGWQPSSPEPSPAAAVTASTRGYVNIRPKYRDFTVTPEAREEEEGAEMTTDLPPAKRRRTFAGTIVSSAVNAALIGTAVGLTVFRLWRDRGKAPELEPPPYEQGDWVPPAPKESTPTTITTPPHIKKKSRSAPDTMRRGGARHRRERTHPKIPMIPTQLSRHSSPHRPTTNSGSDFNGQLDQEDDFENRMDWMGGRLAQLIADGKKALGKEVVVMSEVQDDEEDDGDGNWEEEIDPDAPVGDASRSGSVRRRHQLQARGTASSSSYFSPPPTVPLRQQQFSTAHLSNSCSAIPVPGHATHATSPDVTRLSSSFREDEYHWQSPELRETMERARAAYLRNRQ
ncbi:hypothetical protein F5148DRAFT_1185777 [Russula earlei]|uniref:Uncharacterized protein n=1 Tax=Russula earlei TaxID=71964 RepID=A0ACC0UF00_9AGAM|nr:hypothetical protein F5148DRAFT_1185777 [Russula earlei]